MIRYSILSQFLSKTCAILAPEQCFHRKKNANCQSRKRFQKVIPDFVVIFCVDPDPIMYADKVLVLFHQCLHIGYVPFQQ